MLGVRRARRRAAPGASARCPRPAGRRPPSGRSSPSACAARSSASAAARVAPPSRAARWIARDLVERLVERGGERAGAPRAGSSTAATSSGRSRSPRSSATSSSLGDPREHGRVGDLVAVQVQDRQHGAVASRVRGTCSSASSPRAGPVSASPSPTTQHDEQVGVVERRAEGVRERVAELAALVDRARRLGRDVARDPARERELAEERPQPVLVLRDVRVELAVRALEVGVGDERRAAVARAR